MAANASKHGVTTSTDKDGVGQQPAQQIVTPYLLTSTCITPIAGKMGDLYGRRRMMHVALAVFLVGSVLCAMATTAIKQVPKLLGLESSQGNFWQRLYDILTHLNETHLLTLVIGIVSIGLLFFLEHRFHKLPAALIVMLLGIIISAVFGLSQLDVHVVGEIPTGLAAPKLPGLSINQWLLLLPGALGLALVNFAEAYGPARSFATCGSNPTPP